MSDNLTINWKKLASRIALYFVVAVICVLILYPYFVMLVTSLKTRGEIFDPNGALFPAVPMWSNFVDIWTKAPMAKYLLNSLSLQAAPPSSP